MTTRIKHQSLTETKTVAKPWGQEKWIQTGQGEHTYVLKEIVLNAGNKTSLQVHKFKAETNYILEGTGELVYSNVKLDCDRYVAGKYAPQELDDILSDLQFQKYGPGSVMSIEPGTRPHRIRTQINYAHSINSSRRLWPPYGTIQSNGQQRTYSLR